MIHKTLRSFALAIVALASLQQFAQAGPPLICHPYDIGEAKSLPWSGSQWRDVKADYDLNGLVEDTLALLTPETPMIARMETLRRATIYAVWAKRDHEVGYPVKDQKIADELLSRLMERMRQSVQWGKADALALFDAGYLAASYKDAGYQSTAKPNGELNGYEMMTKAAAMRGGDAEIEFALALMTRHSKSAAHAEHYQKAVAGAKDRSLLARNLVKHFGERGQNIADLRARGNSRKD
jgi:hypothetical protein